MSDTTETADKPVGEMDKPELLAEYERLDPLAREHGWPEDATEPAEGRASGPPWEIKNPKAASRARLEQAVEQARAWLEPMVDAEAVEDVYAEVDDPRPLPARPEPVVETALVARGEMTIDELVAQRELIVQAMGKVMKNEVHYGTIPGTPKPTLYQPGAQILDVLFRLCPSFQREVTWHDDGHLTVISTCLLTHIPTQLLVATGDGLCSTKEPRYAYRTAQRVCPECQAPELRKSKKAPRSGDYEGANPSDPPGWYCWNQPAKGANGCGRNFAANDPRIVDQEVGKVDNPELAELYNTVLKMANKRAHVAATLNGTAAADVFTQDVEDLSEGNRAPSGGGGSSQGYEPRGGQERRQNEPEYPWPANVAELSERFAQALGPDESAAWIREALVKRYDVQAFRDLTAEQKKDAGTRLSRVLRDIELEPGDLAFRPGIRDWVAGLFVKHLGDPDRQTGETEFVMLGPPWRIGSGEEEGHVPTFEEYSAPGGPGDDADVERIGREVFGDGGATPA